MASGGDSMEAVAGELLWGDVVAETVKGPLYAVLEGLLATSAVAP